MDYAPIVQDFLNHNGISNCDLIPVSGDASFRTYWRVNHAKGPHVLMLAPPDKEATEPYVRIAKHLRAHGFNAPEIYSVEENLGLVLLEDFGSDVVTEVLAKSPEKELQLYTSAVDSIIAMQQSAELQKSTSTLNLPDYNAEVLMREAMLFAEWYLPAIAQAHHAMEFETLMREMIESFPQPCTHFVHRDFHVSNLMLLPDESLGLLDFQDALWGAPAYDLVSLLEDARRDVPPAIQAQMLEYYLQKTGIERDAFLASYAFLGAQRNLKILGIFVRLWKRDNKKSYLSLLPRVWGYLMHDVEHPQLAPLKAWLNKHVQVYEVAA